MCKISVLMSVFNEKEEYLRAAMESVLNQTFSDFEFIVYDDCSSQSVKDVLDEYRDRDKRIKLITNEVNRGLTYNLYCGVNLAKGKYIARMDSDDISRSDRFQVQADYLDAHPECVVAACRYNRILNGAVVEAKAYPSDMKSLRTRLLWENSGIAHSGVMMVRCFLSEHSLNYSPQIKKAQDFDLWTRVLRVGEIHILEQPLLDYRIHGGQISLAGKPEQDVFRDMIITDELRNLSDEITDEDIGVHLGIIAAADRMRIGVYAAWKKKLTHIVKGMSGYDVKYLKKLFLYYRCRYYYRILRGRIR